MTLVRSNIFCHEHGITFWILKQSWSSSTHWSFWLKSISDKWEFRQIQDILKQFQWPNLWSINYYYYYYSYCYYCYCSSSSSSSSNCYCSYCCYYYYYYYYTSAVLVQIGSKICETPNGPLSDMSCSDCKRPRWEPGIPTKRSIC